MKPIHNVNVIDTKAATTSVAASDACIVVEDRYAGLCRSSTEINSDTIYGQRNGVLGYWNIERK